MKTKDYKKKMSQHKHHTPQQPKPGENLRTSEFEFEGTNYLVEHDEYSAVVRKAGEDDVLGLFKAAARTWKINDLPMFVQDAVESLYC